MFTGVVCDTFLCKSITISFVFMTLWRLCAGGSVQTDFMPFGNQTIYSLFTVTEILTKSSQTFAYHCMFAAKSVISQLFLFSSHNYDLYVPMNTIYKSHNW